MREKITRNWLRVVAIEITIVAFIEACWLNGWEELVMKIIVVLGVVGMIKGNKLLE